jgi:ABC-type sugar transport system ATPase subunit
MATVTFQHVDKTYPGTRALIDCCLEIADGELMVVVGPSGCGKSTLLRLVAGLETPSRGTLRIGDRVANDLRPQERNVAMVFQDYALYPYLTARGNLEFPLRMRKLPRDEQRQRVERVAALLDIGALLDRLPKQLSGGQRQRVAMGRALVREPTVFLLDEPLSNLDAKLRSQVRAEIKDLQRRTGTTMIYVTHDQVEAMTLGDRVAVLHEGRVQQVATPRDLYEQPANTFVAAFIGNPPMNLLPARIVIDAGGHTTIEIHGQRLRLDDVAASWRAHAGQAVSLGIRPEALRITKTAAAGALEISASVTRTESLGHETLVYGTISDSGAEPVGMIARVPGMPDLSDGERVILELNPADLRLFAADGERIPGPRPP